MLWQFSIKLTEYLLAKKYKNIEDASLIDQCISGIGCIGLVHGIHGELFCSLGFVHYFTYGVDVGMVWWSGEKLYQYTCNWNDNTNESCLSFQILDTMVMGIFIGSMGFFRAIYLGNNPNIWFENRFYTAVIENIGWSLLE
jgi:hypothetical protein